jgi:hypothetical protein
MVWQSGRCDLSEVAKPFLVRQAQAAAILFSVIRQASSFAPGLDGQILGERGLS